jgi:hypothetical protein
MRWRSGLAGFWWIMGETKPLLLLRLEKVKGLCFLQVTANSNPGTVAIRNAKRAGGDL